VCIVGWAGRMTGAGCIWSNVVNLNFKHSVKGHTARMGCEYLYAVMAGKCEGRKPFCRHWSTETGNCDACSNKCDFRVDWMEQYLDGD
jgi:hypothetical protein